METQILKKIEKLPFNLQKEVSEFVDYLLYKSKKHKEKLPIVKQSGFGVLKGKIEMSDDFDEPLEDFKNYM